MQSIPDPALEWDDCQKEVRLRAELFRFKPARRNEAPTQDNRRGAGADSYLNWYWISGNRREIRVKSTEGTASAPFWPAAGTPAATPRHETIFQPVEPVTPLFALVFSGLAVTEDHYLVVGTLEPKGLLVFDLFGGGAPQQICWPEKIGFEPFDIAPRYGGGVWILDRKNRRFWGLDRKLRVITQDQTLQTFSDAEGASFQPAAGDQQPHESLVFPEGVPLFSGSPVEAVDAVAIEPLPDGSVLILDAPEDGRSRVLHCRFDTCLGESALDFAAHDFALAGGMLLVVSAEGNQAFACAVDDPSAPLPLALTGEYYPLRRFGGKALVAAGGRAYYDFGERWLPLVAQPNPRYVKDAWFETRTFDGRDPQCVWHRLMLDACLPPGTTVDVFSRAADDEDELKLIAWEREPALHRRCGGAELPFLPEPLSANRGTFELLLQNARGRFLQLRLHLTGDGRHTPRLRALRIYYPRFSYLERYLPAVYREDSSSASFLERFLANFEGINTAIEDRIAAMQMLFDVRSAPADALAWLASWFGVVLDPAWDEARRRLFIAHAMEFFQWRGTVRGLKMALRLAFDKHVDESIFDPPGADCGCSGRYRIVERFLTRRTPAVEPGDPTAVSEGAFPVPRGSRWKPLDGAAALHARFQAATQRERFTLTPETDSAAESTRVAFARRELGFVPSNPGEELAAWQAFAGDAALDVPDREPENAEMARRWRAFQTASDSQPYGRQRRLWQHFLMRRYVSLVALNQAHATHWGDFDAVGYPSALPANPARLADWYEFEARVLPTLAAAHRFTVLLPVTSAAVAGDAGRRRDLELASRIIDLEKPAHTVFDVKFFWAHFRVGEARLGSDTVLGLGARDPALRTGPAVLGGAFLSETIIAAAPPDSLPGRIITGRDRLQRTPIHTP